MTFGNLILLDFETQVSDVVEKRYEASGMDSTYFWRIDEGWVLDATHAGSVARFINHSCDVRDL